MNDIVISDTRYLQLWTIKWNWAQNYYGIPNGTFHVYCIQTDIIYIREYNKVCCLLTHLPINWVTKVGCNSIKIRLNYINAWKAGEWWSENVLTEFITNQIYNK